MRSSYTLTAALFSLALFANCISARKDSGEYWRQGVFDDDQPKPKLVQGDLVHVSKVTYVVSDKKSHCHSLAKPSSAKYKQPGFTKDFEPIPNASAYTDDVKPENDKSFVKDFEPRPNATAYSDDVKPEDEKSFV